MQSNTLDIVTLKIDRAQECLDRGLILAMFGDNEAAARFYRKALLLDNSNALAHYMLGLALMDDGEANDALQEWRVAASSHCSDSRTEWARTECAKLLNEYRTL